MMGRFFILILCTLLLTAQASAMVFESVEVSPLSPGQEGTIRIEIENTHSDDVEDASLRLDFTDLPITPVGSSQQTVDEVEEDEEEVFVFTVRVSTDVSPGQYEIPYTLTYELNGEERNRSGTIGVTVSSDPDLSFSVSTDSPIIGSQGQITLRIINKGFYDARFVSVRAFPDGFTILSDSEVYIGEIESDDFENANFDVVFTDDDPRFVAVVEYRDFNNELVTSNVDLPLQVYSTEEALQLGLIQPSMVGLYIGIAVVLILLVVLWRWLRKRKRRKKSQQARNEQ